MGLRKHFPGPAQAAATANGDATAKAGAPAAESDGVKAALRPYAAIHASAAQPTLN